MPTYTATCPNCAAEMPMSAAVCPACGYDFPASDPEFRRREVFGYEARGGFSRTYGNIILTLAAWLCGLSSFLCVIYVLALVLTVHWRIEIISAGVSGIISGALSVTFLRVLDME